MLTLIGLNHHHLPPVRFNSGKQPRIVGYTHYLHFQLYTLCTFERLKIAIQD